ncbi:MAG TPA: CarD family transcriptional regulator [Trueperaceae bacterium]
MAFKVGDRVVYPSQGAGVVEEKTTREILGETHEYLKISFIRGDMDVLVPLKKGVEVGLRYTVDPDELAKLYDTIAKADLSLPTQWPPRYRAEQEIVSGGNAYELARLVGVLAQRDLEKGLAATEREVLEAAKGMLASEIAVVKDISLKEANRELEQVIDDSVR